MENSRELKEIGESFSALKRYTVLSGQEDVEDAVIEQGEYPYTMLHTSISGARTAIRKSIWTAFCTLVTSVVIRVTRPAVLNLSMLERQRFEPFHKCSHAGCMPGRRTLWPRSVPPGPRTPG